MVPGSVEDSNMQEHSQDDAKLRAAEISTNRDISSGEGGVNTLTGSVEVAAPQSNIVIPRAGQWRSEIRPA